jgi:hypothetical protein
LQHFHGWLLSPLEEEMSVSTFLEQWVCLLRFGVYEPDNQPRFVVDETAIDSIVANFKGPMPLQSEFANERDPSTYPSMHHTGSMLIAVEKRYDKRVPYLAGLVKTPVVSIAYVRDAQDRKTGISIGPRLTAASYIQRPLLPIESATDPAKSEPSSPAHTPPDSR